MWRDGPWKGRKRSGGDKNAQGVTVMSVYGDGLDYKFYGDILAVGYDCYSRIPTLLHLLKQALRLVLIFVCRQHLG